MKKRFYIFLIGGAGLPACPANLLCIEKQPKEGFEEFSEAEEELSSLFLFNKEFPKKHNEHYVILPTYVYE